MRRSLEQLIEEQVQRWTLERQRKKAAVPVKQSIHPVITISRQFGSRGSAIGQRVAEELGFSFWDKELLHRMAEEAEASESTLSWIDERPRGAWNDFVEGILLGDKYTESEYLRQLVEVVRAISDKGRGVIVGRGSQFILGPRRALRVRFVCPQKMRVESIAERRSITTGKAERLIQKVDKERGTFLMHHYGKEREDPSSFDLIINTGTVTEERATQIVLDAYRQQFLSTSAL